MTGQANLDRGLYYVHELNSNFKENSYSINIVFNLKN